MTQSNLRMAQLSVRRKVCTTDALQVLEATVQLDISEFLGKL